MTNSPLISVVIPTYNRADFIANTINSVLNQTYQNIEILVVDDASTDQTESAVQALNDPRIKYIRLPENTSGTKPRNTGILESRGRYIALLDSDDEWLPDKLQKQLHFINQNAANEENIICFTGLILKSDNGESVLSNPPLKEGVDIMDYILVDDNWVQTSTYMVSGELAKRTLFNPELKKHQDWDFCLRLRENGAKFINLPESLTVYNIEERNDRIGINGKYLLSLQWIKENRTQVSDKAYFSFLAKYVAATLLHNGERKRALDIYLKAVKIRAISYKFFIKKLIKGFILQR
jgi:glycosyltransferase involved in cell wall biosynthesis